MTQVPRPALGMRVLVPDEYHPGEKRIYEIREINHRERIFSATPFKAPGLPWKHKLSFDSDYEPFADRTNFERALQEWDYHYRMSDDPRKYDEGVAQEKALFELFKKLLPADQLHYRKVIAVVLGCE